MSEPRLTDRAEADLEELWAYIAADKVDAADRIVDAILETSRMHVRFPGMCRRRDDLMPSLRCFIVSLYVVFYRPIEDTIEVLRILQGARDIRELEIDGPSSAAWRAGSINQDGLTNNAHLHRDVLNSTAAMLRDGPEHASLGVELGMIRLFTASAKAILAIALPFSTAVRVNVIPSVKFRGERFPSLFFRR
jgi:toxin ParE1/3/4